MGGICRSYGMNHTSAVEPETRTARTAALPAIVQEDREERKTNEARVGGNSNKGSLYSLLPPLPQRATKCSMWSTKNKRRKWSPSSRKPTASSVGRVKYAGFAVVTCCVSLHLIHSRFSECCATPPHHLVCLLLALCELCAPACCSRPLPLHVSFQLQSSPRVALWIECHRI